MSDSHEPEKKFKGVVVFGSNRDYLRVCKTSPKWDLLFEMNNIYGDAPGIHGIRHVKRGPQEEYIVIGFHLAGGHGPIARYKLLGDKLEPDLNYKGSTSDVRGLFLLDDLLITLAFKGNKINVHNFDTAEHLDSIEDGRVMWRMEPNKEKRWIYTTQRDHKPDLAIWDIKTKKVITRVSMEKPQQLHFSHRKKILFVGREGRIDLFSEDGKMMNDELKVEPHERIIDLHYNHRRNELLVCHEISRPSFTSCFDLRMMKSRKRWKSDEWTSQKVVVAEPDENHVITSSSNGLMRTWDGDDDFKLICEKYFGDAVNSLVYIPRKDDNIDSESAERDLKDRISFLVDDENGRFVDLKVQSVVLFRLPKLFFVL